MSLEFTAKDGKMKRDFRPGDHVIGTVRKNLFEGGLLVIAVLFVFLGNLRAGVCLLRDRRPLAIGSRRGR